MPIVTHASFCIFDLEDGIHPDTGTDECAGAIVDLGDGIGSAWLVTAPGQPVTVRLAASATVDLDADALDRLIGGLLELRAQVTA